MANKKISEFPIATSLAGGDDFLFNHLGSTSTVAFSTLSSSITNDSIKIPSSATGGQVLTYNGSTTTWVASAVPKELPSTALSGQVLSYDGSTSTWVASSTPIQDFTSSLSSNGYQKLPSGLITQWGVLSSVSLNQTWHLVNLPISFPNQIFNVSATISYNSTVNGSIGTVIRGLTTTSFSAAGDNSTDSTTGNIYWQAIGY